MSLTNKYDPSNREHKVTCTRTKCAELERPAHPAGVHLDQRSEFYDGPGSALGVASGYIRDSARKIVREAPALMPEVMDLVNYCDFMRGQVAHVQVDRDRQVRDAMARSESCESHGEEIRGLGEQVHAFDAARERSERGRLALLGFLNAVDEFLSAGPRPGLTITELVAALAQASKRAHAAHDRAWKS